MIPAPGVTSALRIEATEMCLAEASIRCWMAKNPGAGAACETVAGGVALFGGLGSPLSQALHTGMGGPVTEGEFDRLEAFFHSRDSAITISVCPHADASLIEILGKRGYRISHFENTLVRTLSPDSLLPIPDTQVAARKAQAGEGELWGTTVMKGFSEGVEPPPESLELFRLFFESPSGPAWIAEWGGSVVAGAAVGVHERGAMFYGDATLPEARGRGAHSALIQARLVYAVEQDCDLAIACTLPGSISQRNYERFGFRVAYTKALMVKEWST
jgi:hypothetical protein